MNLGTLAELSQWDPMRLEQTPIILFQFQAIGKMDVIWPRHNDGRRFASTKSNIEKS